jgi:hypothetical protein
MPDVEVSNVISRQLPLDLPAGTGGAAEGGGIGE